MIKEIFERRAETAALTVQRVVYNRNTTDLTIEIASAQLYDPALEQLIKQDVSSSLPFVGNVVLQPRIEAEIDAVDATKWLLKRACQMYEIDIEKDVSFKIMPEKVVSCVIEQVGVYQKIIRQVNCDDLDAQLSAVFGLDYEVDFLAPSYQTIDDEDFDNIMASVIAQNLPDLPAATVDSPPQASDDDIIYKKKINNPIVKLADMVGEGEMIAIRGEVLRSKQIKTKSGKIIFTFVISDYSDAIKCKLFVGEKLANKLAADVKEGSHLTVLGYKKFDSFDRESVLNVLAINRAAKPPARLDGAADKRIEFNLHTNMSAMDGLTDVKKYIDTAVRWGHRALAITDSGVVQAFPEAMMHVVKQKYDLKLIYGVEAYMIDDQMVIVDNIKPYQLNDEYVVFDIETTGFSARYDGITEIGAIKVKDGAIVGRYSQLVNPEKKIPAKVVELTGITDDMVANKPKIKAVIGDFLAFCGDCPVVAHNATFDVSFIREKAKLVGVDYAPTVLDTLKMSRMLLKDLKRFGLNRVAKYLGVALDNHHRAVDDALATAKIFNILVENLESRGIYTLEELAEYGKQALSFKHFDVYNVTVLAANQDGLKDLYQLISHSHMETFYNRPLISKQLLNEKRQNLILGSAAVEGELYQALLANKEPAAIDQIAKFYDFLEVQPIENHRHLVANGLVRDDDELRDYNIKIINLADALGKLCVATGDVHFLEPDDVLYRKILTSGLGKRVDNNAAPLYFRTTEEMLTSFNYLDDALAERIVVQNSWRLNEQIEAVVPIPQETSPPVIEGSDVELRRLCFTNAKSIYGDPLPEIVESRLTRELDSIINNGYAVMYIIAQKLVGKSLADGFTVGSRGSVGSSFAATMADITEVNPLPPHYYCKQCKYVNFEVDPQYKVGADLPNQACPNCQAALVKTGFDIPFETFLGFEGNKEPDIDLNFASVYQSTAHAYTEELFGEGYTYKAGTIGTVAEKTAFGFVKHYCEDNDIFVSNYEVERLAQGCVGVKRTTGQHPGGIMVVPNYKDIHDFTPIQYPANDSHSGVITTHFDYHSLSGKILKLDNLGHDVPTIIRMLYDMTNIDPMRVPIDDAGALGIFTSTEPLNICDDDYPIESGTLGIPEFGTKFVRGMLEEAKPTTIEELVQISGLSHGTDVWLDNAQKLINEKTCTLKEVIGTRDNIMLYLIEKGLPKKDAFTITESVRKGKGLSDQQKVQMLEHEVPRWYIDSCEKIKYMFPKAHAAAYVTMALRIAYFKVYQPLAYYATYFSIKVDDFDAQLICRGKAAVADQLAILNGVEKMSNKESSQYVVLESALEMYARGFNIKRIDLYRSEASAFVVEDGAILPPLQALQGVGKNAAESIVAARQDGEFISINDIKNRSTANRSVIEALKNHGVLAGMPEDNQLSIDYFLTNH